MGDYSHQFETLTHTIEVNNQELEELRVQLGDTQKQYFSLRVQNEHLEGEVNAVKADRDLQIGLNEERRLR